MNSLHDRLTALQSQQVKSTIIHPPVSAPTIPDRPRLKDYLATMKPETWGSTKVDENIYKPPPMPYMNHPYYNVPASSQPLSMPYLPFAYQPHSNFVVPPPSTQTIPMYQYPQTLPPLPTYFDPYRPQPVGAYDIPTTQPPPLFLNPQDVYRPGGLLGMTQRPMTNPNYDPNQFVQYAPSSSSFANLSINPMSNH